MELRLFNSMTRKKEKFIPIDERNVKMYTCGPTVYDFAHIGNFRTFIFEDLLKRWLVHLGYSVKHVMNITDVDDKIIKRSNEEGIDLNVLTEKYIKHFMNDFKWLKLQPASEYPKATDYIWKMKDIISTLIEKNNAYIEDDGSVYFKINSFKDYGKLAKLKVSCQKQTNRNLDDNYDKESIHDFALWKGWKKDDGNVYWNAPWGKGRPGWHIECSAMSDETLGSHFDIHCGGVDNLFPHHENEIAQSTNYSNKKFVNYWLHSEFLLIDGEKMSKSNKNFFTIKELKSENFTPESLRYQLLQGHYRSKISFSKSKKYESDKIVNRISEFHKLLKSVVGDTFSNDILPVEYSEFKSAMNDDLNSPKALAIFFTWMKKCTKMIKEKTIEDNQINSAINFFNVFNKIFDFHNDRKSYMSPELKDLIRLRKVAREQKNWAIADSIRKEIYKSGWVVEDTKEGQKLREK